MRNVRTVNSWPWCDNEMHALYSDRKQWLAARAKRTDHQPQITVQLVKSLCLILFFAFPTAFAKVQFKTFQLFHIWNVLWNFSQLCTHDFHFTAPGILLMLQVHKGCHASDSDFVHPLFRLGKGSSGLETKHCSQQCSAWYATLLVCCTNASAVGKCSQGFFPSVQIELFWHH